MQIFSQTGCGDSLKNGHLPVKLHSSAPPPPRYLPLWSNRTKSNCPNKQIVWVKATINRGLPRKNKTCTINSIVFTYPCVWLKFSWGARVVTPWKPPPPYKQLWPLPTPCFKMFLERSLNDPPSPTTPLQASITATPSPSITPPSLKILIIHHGIH